MHVDEVLCHGENEGATWETSHRGLQLHMTKNSLSPSFMKDIFAEKIALIACEITD